MAERFGKSRDRFLELCHAEKGIDTAEKNAAVSEIEVAIRSLCAAEDRVGIDVPKYYYIFGPIYPVGTTPERFIPVTYGFSLKACKVLETLYRRVL